MRGLSSTAIPPHAQHTDAAATRLGKTGRRVLAEKNGLGFALWVEESVGTRPGRASARPTGHLLVQPAARGGKAAPENANAPLEIKHASGKT